MTKLALAPQLDAARVAEAAASAAGVDVRELSGLPELEQVLDLYARVWGRNDNPPLTLELLRAFTKAGNYVGGAFTADGRLVGACVGFFHAPADDALHSHIAGVDRTMVGRHVGFALKLHQRAWALERDISEIAWTFDPLVSRNAYFNLVKLAARPAEYLPNFYGPLTDTINGSDESDRLLVRWRLRDPAVERACSGDRTSEAVDDELRAGAVTAVGLGADGGPVAGRLDGAVSLVAVPRDISLLRSTDPELAHRWRTAVRDVLSELLADGARITGFDRSGWYVVRRQL
ncbi:GNAT family N-acetyltransferase [Aeromicrobium wangtongii]|uniref:GNAT family N-acetyltransferase n=1 Tax=Aeromicrobium wangtongii TaxID=2969247 RepID=A0ABY5M7Y3_9ACTN|nr:GNAT family N-acetyltransferase [Aeromicrobium wangtongii]MCD9199117.1 GNAT family N-acetyltransferase [Aeromicrobium wangtongii]UUP12852.1 GNAT family N-acetyltransferase [Aeromicrobium wangtongii]